jgi:hypothetical protein
MFGFNPAILEFLRRQQMQQGQMPMPRQGIPFEGAHNPFGGGYKGIPQGLPMAGPRMPMGPRMPRPMGMPGMAGGKRMMRRPY